MPLSQWSEMLSQRADAAGAALESHKSSATHSSALEDELLTNDSAFLQKVMLLLTRHTHNGWDSRIHMRRWRGEMMNFLHHGTWGDAG